VREARLGACGPLHTHHPHANMCLSRQLGGNSSATQTRVLCHACCVCVLCQWYRCKVTITSTGIARPAHTLCVCACTTRWWPHRQGAGSLAGGRQGPGARAGCGGSHSIRQQQGTGKARRCGVTHRVPGGLWLTACQLPALSRCRLRGAAGCTASAEPEPAMLSCWSGTESDCAHFDVQRAGSTAQVQQRGSTLPALRVWELLLV
jgi:hypothetical protein